MNEEDTNVRVAVRCRPFNDREKRMPDMAQCVHMANGQLRIAGPTGEEHSFGFDYMFGENSTQDQVWDSLGAPILEKAFSGYNGTIFAYGQTGSGKTWSMQGADGDLKGVIPRMNEALFEKILTQKTATPSLQFLVTVSYFELYNEVIFDLLDNSDRKKRPKSGLEVKEHPVLGVYVKGLQEIVVDSPGKIQHTLDQGMRHRTVASTQMNSESSRSHSIFTIKIHQKDSEDEAKNLFAKVNLVDLAGSERVKSTGATGATLKEGANINKSLSALGNVINALVEQAKGKKGFVPYRNSKLTRVLQESLGGNSVTVMIAALSPALVNFDETLSTLKYANRAKDIKVNAVKNDESSQISRLNEEIRALREKLLGQTPTVDTSLLEAKHQQQLRDLEEAMKSTWEDKARVSEEHERERLRLEKEQQNAQQKLMLQREEHWKLLENKADIDMTIGHLKDLLRTVRPDGGSDVVASWLSESREILRLESTLSEQFTAIDVYRTSLTKDGQSLLEAKNKMSNNESKIILGMWKQFRDKFQALRSEITSWLDIQSSLVQRVSSFATKVGEAQELWNRSISEVESSVETSQIARGFELVQRQVEGKQEIYIAAYDRVGDVLLGFESFADKIQGHLEYCVDQLSALSEAAAAGLSSSQEAIENAKKSLGEFVEYFGVNGVLSQKVAMGSSRPTDAVGISSRSREEQLVLVYEKLSCSNRRVVKRAAIGGKESWIITEACSCSGNLQDLPYIDIWLPQETDVSSISLQGGVVPSDLFRAGSKADKGDGGSNIELPCGMGLKDCDGSISHTVDALASLIDWEILIKKNKPEKFLKRPPVRFLFDLILLVVKNSGLDVFPAGSDDINWEVTSQSKQSKVAFMETILSFVSSNLQIPSATSASSIVAGNDGNLTNIFLQHLAFVGYAKKKKISLTASILPPPQLSPRMAERSELEGLRERESWLGAVCVTTSLDGLEFGPVDRISTGLTTADGVVKLALSQDGRPPCRARCIRLYASSWEGSVVCVRFGVHVLKTSRTKLSEKGVPALSSDTILAALEVLRNTANTLYSSVDFLVKIADGEVLRKQEEVRKQLENLAGEKQALEEKLVQEKTNLHNEKQGLEDQLRNALNKLQEAEEFVSKEKMLRVEFEAMHLAVADENASLRISLQEQMDEASNAQTAMTRFQASAERDGKLVETLRKRVDDDECRINGLVDQVEDAKRKQSEWESEKEDLQNQIEVLTEERDAARQNEEELFDELRERTNDLEKLQESYVDMTDRCNDYQDTISDLREQLESMQSMIMDGHRQFIAPAATGPAGIASTEQNNGQSNYDGIATSSECSRTNSYVPTAVAHESAGTVEFDEEEEYAPDEDEDNYEDEFEDDFED